MKQPAPRMVPLLMKMAHSDKESSKIVAARLLGHYGPLAAPAVPVLTRMLDDGVNVAWQAAEALGKIGPAARGALPKLREMAEKHKTSMVRRAAQKAVKALEKAGTEEK